MRIPAITISRQGCLRFGPAALDKFALVPPRLIRVVGSIRVWLACPLELFIHHLNRVFWFEMRLYPFFCADFRVRDRRRRAAVTILFSLFVVSVVVALKFPC